MPLKDFAGISEADLKDLKQLETLRKLNANPAWRNTDIYRLLYKRGFYHIAYEKIKSKPGRMSPGFDGDTLDGYSLDEIDKTISLMRSEEFQPKPSKVTVLHQENGMLRRLGKPSPTDKVVQEVMRMILDAIYDSPDGAYFSDSSHGFRPNRGPHTALREVQKWSEVNWFIQGDITSCLDELDHTILIEILSEKVQDTRFLNLVRKLLKAGYIDRELRLRNSIIGTPQGGILSPLLTNIFLDKLDKYVEELRKEYEKGEVKKAYRPDRALAPRKEKLVEEGLAKSKEFRSIVQQMRDMPSLDPEDENFIRIKYVRYAADWIIGVIGPRKVAEEIKVKIGEFLRDELKLVLSEDKTIITHSKTEQAHFLGTLISKGRTTQTQKVPLSTNGSGHYFQRLSTGWEIIIKIPTNKLVQRLAEKGYCDKEGQPKVQGSFVGLDADQIIHKYSAINKGLLQYYRPCDNFVELRRIQYILKFSLARTLAAKFRKSVSSIFNKGQISAKYTTSKGEEKEVKFYTRQSWKTDRNAFMVNREVNQVRMGNKAPYV